MTHSITAQSTHTNTDNSPISFKTQAGSPKPDISASKKKKAKKQPVVKLVQSETAKLQQLCINQLVETELNVRKCKVNKADDDALYASVLAHGVLQNLIVSPKNAQGLYGVIGGGRRLKVLKRLVKEGQRSDMDKVTVNVLTSSEVEQYASELSLTENFVRASMHPADEFIAFADMVNKGASYGEVAARFGVKEKFVQQRMKLSLVAPVVLEAYKQGDISLDIVMVFTLASVEQQVEVWEKAGKCRYSESQYRSMLKSEAIKGENHLVKYVGQDAYTKAGGIITADLFGDDIYFDDKALLDSLATAKLEKEAATWVVDGWKWAEVKLVTDYEDTKGYGTISPDEHGQYAPAEKALAGCLLVLSSWGDKPVIFHKGLVAKEDKKALALLKANGQPDSTTEGGQAPEPKDDTGYSGALNDDLKAQRLIIAKHALMTAPSVAIDTLYFSVCMNTFSEAHYGISPLHISLHNTTCQPKQGALSDNKAMGMIEEITHELDLKWVKLSTAAERFTAFCALDVKEKEKQVAYATATTLEASIGQSHDAAEAVISTLDVKWSNYWRPNTETFFKRVSQACLIDMATPAMSAQWTLQAVLLNRKSTGAIRYSV